MIFPKYVNTGVQTLFRNKTKKIFTISWNRQAPHLLSAPGNILEPGQIPGRPGLVALAPSQWIDAGVNTEMDNNNKALCCPTKAGSVSQ